MDSIFSYFMTYVWRKRKFRTFCLTDILLSVLQFSQFYLILSFLIFTPPNLNFFSAYVFSEILFLHFVLIIGGIFFFNVWFLKNGIRNTPTWKIPTWKIPTNQHPPHPPPHPRKMPAQKISIRNIPTRVFKYFHPGFLNFLFFHYCHHYHLYYLKEGL